MWLHGLAMGLALVYIVTATNALFLVELGADFYPYYYVSTAVANPLFTAGILMLERRLSISVYLLVLLLADLVLLVALWVVLGLVHAGWIAFAGMLAMEVTYILLRTEFWTLAGRLFDAREARRVYGIVGSGEIFASVVGGLSVPLLIGTVGVDNLLLISIVAVGGVLLCRRAVLGLGTELAAATREPVGEHRHSAQHRSYALRVLVLSPLLMIAYLFADNLFYQALEVRSSGPEYAGAFVGVFLGCAGLAAFVSKMNSGMVMGRFGLTTALLLEPVLVGVAVLVLVVSGVLGASFEILFWAVIALKFVERVTLDGFTRSAQQVLLQALPPRQRSRAQAWISGILEPIAGGLCGLLLLVLLRFLHWDAVQLGAVFLAALMLWIGFIPSLGRRYVEALVAGLRQRVLGRGRGLPRDRQSLEVLERGLSSARDEEVIHCLELLDRTEHSRLGAVLGPLLEHASPYVRARALDKIAADPTLATEDRLRALLAVESEPELKAKILLALTGVMQSEARRDDIVATLLPHLHGDMPEMRRSAAVGLLQSGGFAGMFEASKYLLSLESSPRPDDRRAVAEIIGMTANPALYRPLVELLHDEDTGVREAALVASGRVRHGRLWSHVIDTLDDTALRAPAMNVLSRVPREERGALGTLLIAAYERGKPAHEARVRIIRLCARIRTDAVVDFLLRRLVEVDLDIRTEALRALASVTGRMATRGPGQVGRPGNRSLAETVVACIDLELATAAHICAVLVDLRPAEMYRVLRRALAEVYAGVAERVLTALCVLHPASAVSRLRECLMTDSADGARGRAVEILDNLLDGELAARVLPLYEALSAEERHGRLSARFARVAKTPSERLRELVTAAAPWMDAWLQVCAIQVAVDAKLEELAGDIAAVCERSERLADMAARRMVARVSLLREVGIFSATPDRVLVPVASVVEEMSFAPGQVLIREGERGDALYVIIEGSVRVLVGERVVADQDRGTMFGEMAVLDLGPRSATVVGTTAGRLYGVAGAALHELMAERADIARGIMRELARRLRRLGAASPRLVIGEGADDPGTGAGVASEEVFLPIEKLVILKSVDIFADSEDRVLVAVVDALRERAFGPDEVIIRQGERGDSMYVVAVGRVRIAIDGHEVDELDERQVFGELALVDPAPRSATVSAVGRVVLLELDERSFSELIDDRIEIARGMMRVLCRRIRARSGLESR